ncbi:venom serine protease inhibitor-like [Apis dorsata]|uniref:venom serine protease inhibitor-like n=1 Tax=Apis dorsata TaxID=7462 RepID=UPI0012930C98|nr:venom serine protease inhibitor-like [Apis dorsata]
MSRLVLVSFLFLVIFSVLVGGFGKLNCPRNEIFTKCGALCQPSCAKPDRKSPCIYVSSVIILKDVEYMLNM